MRVCVCWGRIPEGDRVPTGGVCLLVYWSRDLDQERRGVVPGGARLWAGDWQCDHEWGVGFEG